MKHLFALTTLAVLGVGLLLVPARGGDKGLDNPYFPLKKGTTWEYVADGKKITTVVTDHEKVGDLMCAKIETDLGGGQKIIEHVAVKDDGIYRVKANNEEVKPPFLILKLPPKRTVTEPTAASSRHRRAGPRPPPRHPAHRRSGTGCPPSAT